VCAEDVGDSGVGIRRRTTRPCSVPSWYELRTRRARDLDAAVFLAPSESRCVLWPGFTPAFEVTQGDCTSDGSCFTSPGWPNRYGNMQTCRITVNYDLYLKVESFQTEPFYDFLTVNYDRYSGSGVGLNESLVELGSTILWSSDTSYTEEGFKICSVGTCSSPAMHMVWHPNSGVTCPNEPYPSHLTHSCSNTRLLSMGVGGAAGASAAVPASPPPPPPSPPGEHLKSGAI
jgi:hypothetical protein